MTDRPIRERHYRAFLSHAHVDKDFVDQLHGLLARSAGLPIWYDSTSLQASKVIASELPECISQCRGIILVLSQASVNSGWVREEYNYAIGQRTRHPKFQIIPLRIDDCPVPGFLETTKWIDFPQARVTEALYGSEDARLAPPLLDLARIFQAQQQSDEVRSIAHRFLRLVDTLPSDVHTKLMAIVVGFFALLNQSGLVAEAERLAEVLRDRASQASPPCQNGRSE